MNRIAFGFLRFWLAWGIIILAGIIVYTLARAVLG